MLSPLEIERLLKKEIVIMPNEAIATEAETWDLTEWSVSPRFIAIVYSYMSTKYEDGATLEAMERVLGLGSDGISKSLRLLEEHGYLAISRATKPFQYRIIK